MAYPRVPYRVEYTKNKYSRAILRENTIIIRLAKNLSAEEHREHVQSLLERMMEQVRKEHHKKLIHPFRHILQGGQSQTVRLATGKTFTFTLIPGTTTKARRKPNGWHITVSPHIRRKTLHRLLWSLIAKEELPRIAQLVARINDERTKVHVKNVRVAFAQSQWGSCSPRGTIMLNAALLFAPPSLLCYVIVHELVHRRVSNHSQKYWNLVEEALPNYKRAIKKMQQYRLPTL
ncbi:hypothetical protein COU77_02815 [Candidatus Peregrinibacteria bacterium CG10_big_fil_rev_8_21_14_0_10_49_16]|nr:MAG: hypothetical protein COW95_02330 [Candidatus Peregrinibacteria bacterium CG22_combo_CG10-13_8_21_14_all_49_11]PIR51970.1 MAG: hypothetical protein COU77_02815 [Candidatus Peregrinibacteria bacterium CG10_big_fil_rev_8_21_14_0_10_49_16]